MLKDFPWKSCEVMGYSFKKFPYFISPPKKNAEKKISQITLLPIYKSHPLQAINFVPTFLNLYKPTAPRTNSCKLLACLLSM